MITKTESIIPAGTKKVLHVDQHIIKANTKNGTDEPAITIQTSKGPYKAHEAEILGPSTFVSRPHDPLSCGARLFITTTAEIRTLIR